MNQDIPKIRQDIRKINSWQDADAALGVLRLADARVSSISAEYDAQIQLLEAAKQKACQPHLERTERVGQLLEAWVTANRDTLGAKPDAKSRKLVHGVVGFKKGTPRVVFVAAEEHIKKMLKARGHVQCLESKESIVKKAVADLPKTELGIIGAKIEEPGDQFYYKLNVDAPVEYPEATAAEPE